MGLTKISYCKYTSALLSFLAGSVLISDISFAKEYPYNYRSSYFLGRGDTGIADADNEDAIFYNPSGIAFGSGLYKKTIIPSVGLQLSNSTKDVFTKISFQEEDSVSALRDTIGTPQHVGGYLFGGLILRRAAVGFYNSSTVTALVAKDPDEGAIEKAEYYVSSKTGVTFTVAQDFLGNQAVGLTTRVIANATELSTSTTATDLESSESNLAVGSGYGFDVGYTYKYKGSTNINMGATIENLFDTTYEITDSGDDGTGTISDDPMTVNLGVSVEKQAHLSSFKFLFDYRDLLSATDATTVMKTHFGTEISLDGWIGLTAGLNQGYPTFGVYGDIRLIRVDAGIYTEEIGDRAGERGDKRIYIRVLAGF